MKKAKELRSLSPEEINKTLGELRKEIMKDNVHISAGTAPANPGKLRQTKKTIARLLTILNEKGGRLNK